MPRILHTADWHLGAPKAHPVFLSKLMPTIIKAAKKYECEYVLVVGDIFDRPKPDQRVKDILAKQLLNANNELTFIFTVGNHDYTNKLMEYHSLKNISILRDASGNKLKIHVLEPGETIEFDEFQIKALSSLDDISEVIDKPTVLAWHGTPPGIKFNGEKTTVDNSKIRDIIKAYSALYFALGDIHRPWSLHPKCYYSGPPVQKAYSDEDGIIVFDTDTGEIEQKRLPLPKKVTLSIASDEDTLSEDEVIAFVKEHVKEGNLVKLKFEVPLSTWGAFDQSRVKNELSSYCLDLVLENDPVINIRSRKLMQEITSAKSMKDELDIVLEDEDTKLDKDRLKKTCRKYIQE